MYIAIHSKNYLILIEDKSFKVTSLRIDLEFVLELITMRLRKRWIYLWFVNTYENACKKYFQVFLNIHSSLLLLHKGLNRIRFSLIYKHVERNAYLMLIKIENSLIVQKLYLKIEILFYFSLK